MRLAILSDSALKGAMRQAERIVDAVFPDRAIPARNAFLAILDVIIAQALIDNGERRFLAFGNDTAVKLGH